MVGGATILTFVALLYLIELIDQLTRHSLDANGTGRWRPTACGESYSLPFCTPTGSI